MAVEAFAVLTAIWQHRDLLTGKDVIFLKDNEAAASAIIKDDSRLLVVGNHGNVRAIALDPLQHRGVVRVGRL